MTWELKDMPFFVLDTDGSWYIHHYEKRYIPTEVLEE